MPRLHTQCEMRHGFTLVEMSIVIAIIGLLIGAIMSGQYMLKQSEVQSVMADFNKFKGAYLQFRQQYGGPPGDLVDAVDYWGTDSAGCPGGSQTFKTTTCNGDGDGLIDLQNDTREIWRAWQHLSNAGFITGSFTGAVGGAGSRDSVTGENVPAGRRTGTGYSIYWMPTVDAANYATYTSRYAGDYGTMVQFGLQNSGDITNGAALTPREAMRLDAKYDDGMPASGAMFADRSSTCASSSTYSATTATYTPSSSNLFQCSISLLIDR